MKKTLLFDKIEGVGFKHDNSFFSIFGVKYSNKAFLVLNLQFFLVLNETLHFEKFEGFDFKNGSLSKLQSESTQVRPKFKAFSFCMKLCELVNLRVLV